MANWEGVYPFFPWYEATENVSIPLDGIPVHRRLLPSKCWYPFILLGGERQVGVKCTAQGHNTRPAAGFEPLTLRSSVTNANH